MRTYPEINIKEKLLHRLYFYLKTIKYAFIISIVGGPSIGAVLYYPEIFIPFACGIITGWFANADRRDRVKKIIKEKAYFVAHDLELI